MKTTLKKLAEKIRKQELYIEEIKSNAIYRNAFEWRFEFPEVLDNDGNFEGFDVVIGNPPYINSKGEKFIPAFKNYALVNFLTAKYQIDTYILFIEKSLSLISKKGFISYIVPNAWLNNLFLEDVRKFFLFNMAITEISGLPSTVFQEATVDTIILSGRKAEFIGSTSIRKYIGQEFVFQNMIEQSNFLNFDGYNINIYQNDEVETLLMDIEKNSISLDSITSIARGVGVYHKRVGHTKEIIERDPYQSNTKKDKTFVPYLRGRNVKPFYVDWNNDSYISYGKWLAEPREPKYFDGERIILRQIPGKKLIATYIDKHFITDQSVFIARFEKTEISAKAILGIIGSKLMAYYFRNKYSEFDDLFPKMKLQHFKNLPINSNINKVQKDLVSLVESISKLKIELKNSEKHEIKLDEIVYKLYNISDEQIKLIESSPC